MKKSDFQNDVMIMAEAMSIPATWLDPKYHNGQEFIPVMKLLTKQKKVKMELRNKEMKIQNEINRQNNLAAYIQAPDEFEYGVKNENALYENQMQFAKLFNIMGD